MPEGHEAVTAADFAGMQAQGLLSTWWNAHDLECGVRKLELALLNIDRGVVVNGSRAHLPNLRLQAPHLRVVEIAASPELLAARLVARAREESVDRESRLHRRIETDVNANLVVVNDGELHGGVAALQHWWESLP
jgi:phosphonate metabolism protein PhnN/1,5-bisphosphokinase (PRPP-forming)